MSQISLVGRQPEARAIVTSVERDRSVLVVAGSGMGKTALLEILLPVFADQHLAIYVEKLAPFGNTLRDIFTALWDARALGKQLDVKTPYKSLEEDRKAWSKKNPNNDTKCRSIREALTEWGKLKTRPVLLIDDANGVASSMIPWLVEWEKCSTLVLAVTPEAIRKAGTKRLWSVLEEVKLPPLSSKETGELVDKLTNDYGVVVSEPQMYRNRLITVSGGNPGEVVRLIKHVQPEDIVRAKDVLHLGQSYVERQERGIAVAPLILVLGAFVIAWKYIARAQGNLDGYVLSGIALSTFVVARLLFGGSLRPRSS